METKKFIKEIEEKITKIATIAERNRIMREIEEANLPAGVWTMIKDIINPPTTN